MDYKILIVEDEFVTANALRLLLEKAGHFVMGSASSAKEAYKMLQQQRPDLVLLDIRLEGKETGIDLAGKLKDLNIGFVYLSANSSQDILEEAKKTEPYGFLVKPYRGKDVLVALEIAYYRHMSSQESRTRQVEMLRKQLTGLTDRHLEGKQALLEIAGMLQPHIPFDLIIVNSLTINGATGPVYGYMRTGYDEYQPITENRYCLEATQAATGILDLRSIGTLGPFENVLRDHYRISTYLNFTARCGNGAITNYFFCSRNPDVYHQQHLELISGLGLSLASLSPDGNGINLSPQSTVESRTATLRPVAFKAIIGTHPLLLAALDLTAQVAPFTTSVLLLGESGTGKEKIAEAIHTISKRPGLLVKVNCAAIPASLMESELFGYEKGAFTGANESRKGKFELASGGTLFLDEIGELSLDLQARLLRVLQQKEIDPLGSSMPRKIDVRIIAATNRNLEKAVGEGYFRLDLYYRLNVFPIVLPALNDRKSDLIPLAVHFAERFCREMERPFSGISAAMAAEMLAYDWPGNIRELENVIQRSVILNDGGSELKLRQRLAETDPEVPTALAIENFGDIKSLARDTERAYILSALTKANGRIRGDDGAAALLNIKPTTLESKMTRLGITKDDFKSKS